MHHLRFFTVTVLSSLLLLASCGGRSAVRPSAPVTPEVKQPPASSRDLWQLPETVIDLLEMQPGMAVLDLGAGAGYMTRHLAKAVGKKGKVIAVEIDAKLVASLGKLVQRRKLTNVQVVQSSVSDLPATDPVDRILLLNTYPELEDPVGMIGALTQRLKPGGWLVIIDYLPDAKVPGPPLSQRLAITTVQAEARGAGLSLVATSDRLPRQYVAVFMRAAEVSVPPPAAPLPAGVSEGSAP